MAIPTRKVNFLESYEAYKRLERNPTYYNPAFTDLADIEGDAQAQWLLDYLNGGSYMRAHPILWHPGQAVYAIENIPELAGMILEDADKIGIVLIKGFVSMPFDIDWKLVERLLNEEETPIVKDVPQSSFDDIFKKYGIMG
ncbi:MAG: hypothetical protein HC874_26155 [Richelia sp. SL_2_1]|nr:hypothetical protein [Richelia sp. SL_2_1]